MSPRRSATAAAETRRAIVDRAVRIASTRGLEGVTIGALASDLDMSKAGVLGHFGTKEGLQLAALDRAVELFLDAIVPPSRHLGTGLARLGALVDAWLAFLDDPGDQLPGGCFLTAVSCEFDSRPGAVRTRAIEAMTAWLAVLRAEAAAAVEAGELPRSTDPSQLAFELNALAMGANQARLLLGDPDAIGRARTAMGRLLSPAGST